MSERSIIIYDFQDDFQKEEITKNLSDFENIIKKYEKTIIENYNIDKEISLFFVDKDKIRELNNKYRNIDKDTDVLSFNYSYASNMLGEIVICFEKIIERSIIEEESIENTLIYMLFHSFLHLVGFDHNKEVEYDIFEEKTEELLRRYSKL
ncbi:MAG: rRNA maturation RNase YbeY [Exilispira sp.]